jgi:hypothetical protein
MPKEVPARETLAEDGVVGEAPARLDYGNIREHILCVLANAIHLGTSDILTDLLNALLNLEDISYGKRKAWAGMPEKVERIDNRTLGLASAFEKLEADVHALKEKERRAEPQRGWPSYASEDFERIAENARGLEDAGDDKSQILYHIMELEASLGSVEGKARATDRKYEARLAASLRDICRVHEPREMSDQQIICFHDCLNALIEGWGKLNRERVRWIRGRLMEVGLTWLPVTDKAVKDISQAQNRELD